MKKNWGRTKLVRGRLNPVITLSDCGNYSENLLNFSLQNSSTRPTGGEIAQ